MRALGLAAVVWFLVGGTAVAAGAAGQAPADHTVVDIRGPAVIPASAGRPMQVPEPTYRWHGLTVPVGACGAIVGGRAMVLSCGDTRVVAYRRQRAEQRATDWRWAGVGAAAAVASGVGFLLWRRRTRVRRGV